MTPDPTKLARHYLQGFGFDRLCGLTGTVFGPGLGEVRTRRVVFLQAINITSFLQLKLVTEATSRTSDVSVNGEPLGVNQQNKGCTS